MSNVIVHTNTPEPQDPQLAALVNKVTRVFQLEIMSAIARLPESSSLEPVSSPAGSVGKMVHHATEAYFGRLSPAHRDVFAKHLVNKAMFHDVLRTGVISSPISSKLSTPILSQVNIATEYAFLADEGPVLSLINAGIKLPKLPTGLKLSQSILSKAPKEVLPMDELTNASPGAVLDGGLELRLHSVTCVQPTNDGWLNPANEINLGGVTTDDQGNVTAIPEFVVNHQFKKNVSQQYDPPRVLRTFSMTGPEYPKIFTATLVLAEKDSGGFAAFLEELYSAVKKHIEEILATLGAAAGAAIGAKIGGTIGTIGGPLGSLIGVVAGMVVGALVGWLTNTLKDDIFTPQMTNVSLPGSKADFDGKSESPVEMLNFYDHGGHFQVRYSWKVKWA